MAGNGGRCGPPRLRGPGRAVCSWQRRFWRGPQRKQRRRRELSRGQLGLVLRYPSKSACARQRHLFPASPGKPDLDGDLRKERPPPGSLGGAAQRAAAAGKHSRPIQSAASCNGIQDERIGWAGRVSVHPECHCRMNPMVIQQPLLFPGDSLYRSWVHPSTLFRMNGGQPVSAKDERKRGWLSRRATILGDTP